MSKKYDQYDQILSYHLTSQSPSDKHPSNSSSNNRSQRRKHKRSHNKKRSRSRSRSRSRTRKHKDNKKRNRDRDNHRDRHTDRDRDRHTRDRNRNRNKKNEKNNNLLLLSVYGEEIDDRAFTKKVEEELKAKEIETARHELNKTKKRNKRKERLKRLQKLKQTNTVQLNGNKNGCENNNIISSNNILHTENIQDKPAEPIQDYDIFAKHDEIIVNNTHTNCRNKHGKNEKENLNLTHNWDDSEGYYVTVPGDIILGKYCVMGISGKGAYSSVLRVEENNGNINGKSEFVIKIIRNNEFMKKQGIGEVNFLNEISECLNKNKIHIILLHNSFWYRNHLCLLFESMKCDLRHLLNNINVSFGGLSISAVYEYCKQLLSALVVLDELGIIHADIKPDNILVSSDYRFVKLCDFGSSYKLSEVEISPTIGSRYYRAPEIMIGIKCKPSCDIWSLGCSLFEIYCSNFLFKGDDNNQMLLNIVSLCCFDKNILLQYKNGMFYNSHFNGNGDFLENKFDSVAQFDIQIPHKLYLNNNHNKYNQKIKILYDKLQNNSNKNITVKLNYNEKIKLNQFADLLSKMLNLNVNKRITPKQALKHPFCVNPVTPPQPQNNNKKSKK
eukprot:218801_1